jgi:hypothetical protein
MLAPNTRAHLPAHSRAVINYMALYEHLQSCSPRISDSSEKLPKRTRDFKTNFLKRAS